MVTIVRFLAYWFVGKNFISVHLSYFFYFGDIVYGISLCTKFLRLIKSNPFRRKAVFEPSVSTCNRNTILVTVSQVSEIIQVIDYCY